MKKTVFTGQFTLLNLEPASEKKQTEFKEIPKKQTEKAEKKVKKAGSAGALMKFYKENNGIIIDDMSNEASVNAKNSKSFMSFCRKLKGALKKEAMEKGFVVTLKPGHYDMHGFFKKGEQYVYWSFAVERYGEPTSLDGEGALNGFLYRRAKSEKDFTGGNNHFCNLLSLVDNVSELIKEGAATNTKAA